MAVDAPHARLLLRIKGSNASIKTGALITLGGVLVVGAPPGTGRREGVREEDGSRTRACPTLAGVRLPRTELQAFWSEQMLVVCC